jgi:phospholipid transport system transporter-binding protein
VTDRDLPAPSLTSSGAGLIAVKGPVTFGTAGTLLASGKTLFAGQPVVTVNLHEVTNVDSAGLALLLEWLREARAEGRTVTFQGSAHGRLFDGCIVELSLFEVGIIFRHVAVEDPIPPVLQIRVPDEDVRVVGLEDLRIHIQ